MRKISLYHAWIFVPVLILLFSLAGYGRQTVFCGRVGISFSAGMPAGQHEKYDGGAP